MRDIPNAMLHLNNISKSFGEHELFRGITRSFGDAGLVLVLGASGSGKTTLLRILAGLEKPDTGHIEKDEGLTPFAFQDHRLFPSENAVRNITVIRPKDPSLREEAEKALRAFGFDEEDMKKQASLLSGGMKQRVSLLRTMLSEGSLLLLDEPTKELDSLLAGRVVERIAKEADRRLVFVATHTPDQFSDIVHETIRL